MACARGSRRECGGSRSQKAEHGAIAQRGAYLVTPTSRPVSVGLVAQSPLGSPVIAYLSASRAKPGECPSSCPSPAAASGRERRRRMTAARPPSLDVRFQRQRLGAADAERRLPFIFSPSRMFIAMSDRLAAPASSSIGCTT